MKKLKELLVVISLFLTIIQTSYCIEADNKNEIVASAQAVTKDMYENANYVIVYQKESVEYEETGKYKSENDVYIKVLDEKGKNDNSTIVYSYDKNYGKSDVNLVEVISENGVTRKINIEANKSEQMATGDTESNIYDSSEILVSIKIPGLNVGDTVHYISRDITEKPRVENEFSYFILGEMTQPIINYIVEIKGPALKPIKKNEILNKIEGKYSYSEKKEGEKIVIH